MLSTRHHFFSFNLLPSGGRVYQAEYDSLPPIDMGGEIIHGCNTRVHKMAVEFNWDIEMVIWSQLS